MIFEEIKLYNFGIYQGHHTISLDSPDHKKPIILIGALNGAGKTTFLDALQLALYGKFAKCSNRGRLGYLAYLEKNINSFSEDKAASVSLRFRHGDDKKAPQVYEIKRSWVKEANKECRENISVCFNGKHDQLLSEHWEEFVNEFIPQSISELFFFDGEKIENFADPKRSAELLRTGIEALLGLELLSTLAIDLNELKKKKQEKQLNKEDTTALEDVKKKLVSLNKYKDQLSLQLKSIEVREKEEEVKLAFLQHKMHSSGADKLDLKSSLEKEKTELSQKLFAVKHELFKLVSGPLPLGLLGDLLSKADAQAILERKSNIFKDAEALLQKQKEQLLNILSNVIDNDELSRLKSEFNKLLENEREKNNINCYLDTNPIYFSSLSDRIAEDKRSANKLLGLKTEIEEAIVLSERKINAIPTLESVKELFTKHAKQEEKLAIVQKEKEQLVNSLNETICAIKQNESQLSSILISTNSVHFEHKRQNQIVKHIDTLKEIILSFNKKLVRDNITKLEKKIKSKFDQLKRKDSLISKIEINPFDYSMTLFTSNKTEISTDRLSAGERQLLAIAILWGLADSSGKELPTIIDTPMGRLDGEHRTRLIEQYFPNAASQVILLSTDEEIYGRYYNKLKSFIAQEYHIEYDEKEETSYFSKGYLEGAL
ncbi:DNA sulfur modification protein DndD [Trabulsiella odontotermitis]|uniref:DNA sulfur modification protein DndD n=1 Tax=Trabulsiella odontotermitis TaxID=379893 RepID=UPI0006BA574F|nr:DNA sulfur modification protein DndD [Trabulsiella odontotermitis]